MENSRFNSMSTVCVVGLGYIGLPTAAFIASKGLNVVGVDINEEYVRKINAGEVPFFEPDFEELLARVVRDGKLVAKPAPVAADAYIIAVPTPFNDDHTVNIAYIRSAALSVAPYLSPGALVVLESTSPPKTTEEMARFIIEARPDLTLDAGAENAIFVAHCPERVLPGRIMVEMETNDRVIGGLNEGAAELARELYSAFCNGEMLLTDATTAEMAKLTENSFRDVNIAFANELSIICEDLGIDVWELIELANHHPRVNILNPGPGVGGHCIAVDPWFIVSSSPKFARLIRTAREVNDSKPQFVINKVNEAIADKSCSTVALLGIAFKADIDDLRESPALKIAEELASAHPKVTFLVVEPNSEVFPKSLASHENVRSAKLEDAIDESDMAVLLVDHKEFRDMDFGRLTGKPLIDTRGLVR